MRRALLLIAPLVACSRSEPPHVLLDFSRPQLFDAPFPADDVVGTSRFANPDQVVLVEQVRALLADTDGFARTGGVFFQISTALDTNDLPSIAATTAADAPVFVVSIDPAAPDYGVRYPLEVSFRTAAGLYGAPNLLALLPLQGMPLRAKTRYAAVVTTALHAEGGERLAAAPAAVLARFPDARAALHGLGVADSTVAGVTAFTTGDPTAQLAAVRAAALARPLPAIDTMFALTATFDDFCVYQTTIAMPDWQSGTSPFTTDGGTWQFDATGAPIFQRTETARLYLTIPRAAPPASGYPLVVFVRTGGGGDRPLVDRGQQSSNSSGPIIGGEGPARYFARAGFAGIQVDGPIGGMRNTTGGDEQYLTFDVANLGAMRDNIREAAVELDVIAHVGIALQVSTTDCLGSAQPSVGFDASHVAIMGHSMGSWIAPLAVADEPLFRVALLSGAGGSWIENIMYKQHPTPVYPVLATILHEPDLRADDPMMTLAQWALEAADPQVYGAALVREPVVGADPRHVLMMQGIVDDYILPRIANATSLSIGLDLGGPELDTETDPRLADELAIGPLLALDARAQTTLPLAANVRLADGRTATAALTQHPEDGVLDGHEVVFQTDPPKHEYQCFLASWLATGVPSVPTAASRDAPCP
jgi:hypothetical protein